MELASSTGFTARETEQWKNTSYGVTVRDDYIQVHFPDYKGSPEMMEKGGLVFAIQEELT